MRPGRRARPARWADRLRGGACAITNLSQRIVGRPAPVTFNLSQLALQLCPSNSANLKFSPRSVISIRCFSSANYRTKNLAVARDGCHSPGMTTKSTEADSLAFVSELQVLLAKALDSIVGKANEAEASYLVWGATHVNKTVAGYVELRKRQMVHASKIMVRPVIEATAAVIAANKEPGFLFEIAWSEYKSDRKLIEIFHKIRETIRQATASLQQELADLDATWVQFNKDWCKTHPPGPAKPRKLQPADVLHTADLDPWYGQYRLYCQFTHGALRAVAGDLDEMTDPADNLVIAWLTLMMLDQLQRHAPVEIPALKPFWEQAECLMRQTAWSPQQPR